ncbi:sensor histidine kinase [Ponticoccus alexandrii]|uniref:histidine kinase n=1 Tax=Ponticoccus alexandrii TaxID=1943633 RepID=A0ABX7FA04_9RHOB|nr:ATP-binding protein [Ponticoccus alexandrii]KID12474.1 C4-dicarboxylate ABC transporter [Rhodobacteraceae bacterium PD-2]QRF66971.1 sensor histidine kinase [Ponticoccus alexandrii]
MTHSRFPRSKALALFLGAVLGLGWIVWQHGYGQALGQVAARGQSDLALASDRLVTGLQRFRSAAVLLADHPDLRALHAGGDRARAEARLLESADLISAHRAFYADSDGRVLASAFGGAPQDLTARPWYRRALTGALGFGHEVTAAGARSYVHAAPSFAANGEVQGALVLMVDLDILEREWRGTRPSVFFTDDSGQILVTNRSEILFWRRDGGRMVGPGGETQPLDVSRGGGHEIWRQSLSPYVPPASLHLTRALPVIDLTAEALVDIAPARRLAALQGAAVVTLCLFFGSLLFIATERRRALAEANVLLEGRVRARTRAWEEANSRLRAEVREREDAEAALRRAQADLVQAGKLSALGQMSAGISHELNQPLTAIRQYAENGTAFLNKGRPERAADNLARIAAMAARAARIIRNLRAFARNESEPMGKVDLVAVIDAAVELTEARLKADGVTLVWEGGPPAYALGGEVRLGQVFVNLINNAADAMAGEAEKRIAITLERGPRLRIGVSDTGPGIADPDRMFEPFYSTKEVGGGMGLGLSISYGLVQSFGGEIRGSNTGAGAVFTVELEPWLDEAVA